MSYPAFPSIQLPDLPFREKWEDCGMIFKTMDGPDISRAARTKSRLEAAYLNWSRTPLSAADYATLQTFLKTTVLGSARIFTWSHPISGVSYNVRCIDMGEWEWAADDEPGWSGGIIIKEA